MVKIIICENCFQFKKAHTKETCKTCYNSINGYGGANNNYNKLYIAKHKEDEKARQRTRTAINSKKHYCKDTVCLLCNKIRKVEIHHLSYKPNMSVYGLCKDCHEKVDNKPEMLKEVLETTEKMEYITKNFSLIIYKRK